MKLYKYFYSRVVILKEFLNKILSEEQMRYREFLAKGNNLECRVVGILGENHLYRAEETEFAKEIVPTYSNIAMEGNDKSSDFANIVAYLFLPAMIAYATATNRTIPFSQIFSPQHYHETAEGIAIAHRKNIHYLEEDRDEQLAWWQKAGIMGLGLASIPLSPVTYVYEKIRGDRPATTVKLDGIQGALANVVNRDKSMAERSLTLLRSGVRDLLVVCGAGHMEGIIHNLSQRIELKKIKELSPNYRS